MSRNVMFCHEVSWSAARRVRTGSRSATQKGRPRWPPLGRHLTTPSPVSSPHRRPPHPHSGALSHTLLRFQYLDSTFERLVRPPPRSLTLRLKFVQLKNFKRFAELTIQSVPPEAKLIILLGPNGCGKSSLFDAFQRKLKMGRLIGIREEWNKYYQRSTINIATETDGIHLEFHGDGPSSTDDFKKSLYIRSAYRHDPSFRETTIQQQRDLLDRHAVHRLIDTDKTVENNYQRLIWRLLKQVTTPGLTTDEIMRVTIGDLQKSMSAVFGDVHLDALVAAQETGTFTFTKKESRNFLYENLSAGEKATFDLLLDVVVNKIAFDDTIYCIDEPEAHLSTRVQGTLLKELYRLLPSNCQLWLATHSLGMVRTAQEIRSESPEHVVFLDMGFNPDGTTRDYDKPQTVEPAEPDYNFWSRHYAVALDDMSRLLAPDCIVLCEGSTEDDEPALDESCYNKIFAQEFPQTRFISVGPATKVERRMGDLLPVLDRIVKGMSIIRLRDRDNLTPEEIDERRKNGVRVLSEYRNLESMLLSDSVLSRLCYSVGGSDCAAAILQARDGALDRPSVQYASDDLKPAAQAVHHAARTILKMSRAGK